MQVDILGVILEWILSLPALFAVLVLWVALLVGSGLLVRAIRHRARDAGVHPDAVNGIILAIRLIFLFIGISALVWALPFQVQVSFAAILGGSSLLLGTAIGLATGQAVRNLVSGIYVMFTHPFRVEEYVRIGDQEGIVEEISMNYTKIMLQDRSEVLIPNTKVLDSAICDFTIEKKDLLSEEERESDPLRKRILRSVTHAMAESPHLVRYTLTVRFPISMKLDSLLKAFDIVCERWTKKFGYRPVYELSSASDLALAYTFTLFADDPLRILDRKSEFLSDLVRAAYAP